MLVSVIVATHNYGRFLPECIDSVLEQTHAELEFIVVDDGSTDDSAEVLARYGDRLSAVFKEQGGQASAINAGIARARGELVCMLDADDTFLPDKVERVVQAWREVPGAVLVNHQLQSMDVSGAPSGRPWPASIPSGDLRPLVVRTGGWYPRGVMSSLTFTRSYLQQLAPIPTEPRTGTGPRGPVQVELKADTYLALPAAFVGPVAAVDAPLTRYRIHGANKSLAVPGADASRAALLNKRVAQYDVEHRAMLEVLARLGIDAAPRLEDHFEQAVHLRGLGAAGLVPTAWRVLGSPAMAPGTRLREVARLLAGRGWGARSN